MTIDLLRAAVRDFRRAWLALAAYELAVKLLAGPVVVPAAAWLLARLVATTGRTAVSNTDIVAFVFTPTGMLTAALASVAILSATLLEHTGLLAVAPAGPGGASPRRCSAGTCSAPWSGPLPSARSGGSPAPPWPQPAIGRPSPSPWPPCCSPSTACSSPF